MIEGLFGNFQIRRYGLVSMKNNGNSLLLKFPCWIGLICLLGFFCIPLPLFSTDVSPEQQKLLDQIADLYDNRFETNSESVLRLWNAWEEMSAEDTSEVNSLIFIPAYHLYHSLRSTRQVEQLEPFCQSVLRKTEPFRAYFETEWLTWIGRTAESLTFAGRTREGVDRWYQLKDTLLSRPVVDSFFVGEVMLQICREAYYQRWLEEGLEAGKEALIFLNGYNDSDMYSSVLLTLGRIYRLKSEYVQAITHFRRAVDILETIPKEEKNPAALTIPYVEIAQTYESQGKSDLCISFYEKATRVMQFPTVKYGDQISILGNLTGACRLKSPEKALGYLDQALDIFQLSKARGDQVSIATPITLEIRKGRILHQLNRTEEGKQLLKEQLIRSEQEELRFQALFAANVLTRIALKENQPEDALGWWQKGFECYQGVFTGDRQSWDESPDFSVLSASLNIVTFLIYRGEALVALASKQETPEKEQMLDLAAQTASVAQNMLFEIRRSTPERSQGYNNRFQELQALKIKIELLSHEGTSSMRAFSLMDHSKVLGIQEDWMFEQRKREGDIDPALTGRLTLLEREIVELEASIFDQELKGKSDSVAFQQAYKGTQLLVEKRRELHALEDSVESLYPTYQLSSLTLPQVTADMVRAKLLDPQEAVISFFYTPEDLFWSVLTDREVKSGSISLTDSVSALLNSVIYQVRVSEGFGQPEKLAESITLYHLLFGEMESVLEHIKHLRIIPDGPLVELPFEALATRKGTGGRPEYLLDRYAISYWLSARSRWILEEPEGVSSASGGYLASFAPQYPEGGEQLALMAQDSFVQDLVRAGEFRLPGALQEASLIADMWNGQVYKGAGVTEEEFLREAGNFSVLHLAMHALVEKEQEDFSRLLFAPSDSERRGFLSAIEIAEMNLPAEMVVLSACNTGRGQWRAGEGVFHLGRAFRLAGVRSLVLSLWQVPDRATSEMMPSFYQELKDGKDKAEALRQAKLAYLEQADPAFSSPYYWAGFILMGDQTLLPAPSPTLPWGWIIGLILLGTAIPILVFGRKQRK